MSALEQAARDLEKKTARLMHVGCEAGAPLSEKWGGEWRTLVADVRDLQHALRAALDAGQAQPVAVMRTWHKGGERHADLWEWLDGIDSLPDGEHHLYASPPARQPLTQWAFASFDDWWDHHGFHNASHANLLDARDLMKLSWEVARERAHGIT